MQKKLKNNKNHMANLHDKLMKKDGAYAKWHNHPRSNTFQWLFLLVVVSLAGGLLLNRIKDPSTYGLFSSAKQNLQQLPVLEPAQDHILVKFKDTVGQTKRAEVLAKHGLSEISEIKQIGVKLVKIPDTNTPQETVDSLNAQDKANIDFAEVDALLPPNFIPNDPYFANQWERTITNAPAAWDTTQGSGVIIAIADTGTDCTHPDLNCVPGWNFYDNNSDTHDANGHGTWTAGTAAAVGNNAQGVAGQAFNARIMPIRISDASGYAYFSTIANGITWAADHGAKVVNNSFQSSGSSSVQQAGHYLKSKGGLLTVSEGNYSADAGTAASNDLISVSATDPGDNLYSFSSFGSDTDVSAPGCVTTTANGGGYASVCGTSFSAPMTAGTLALIFSANSSLTPDQAQNILFSTAKDLGTPGYDIYYGWGRIDAGAAVAAAGTGPAPDTIAPSTPQNLIASALNSSQVNLSWAASTDNIGVVGYKIYRGGNQIGTSSGNSYIDNTVSASTSYSYTVSAYDLAGNTSALSNAATVTTPAATVVITSFQVTSKTATTATIAWTTNLASTGSVSYGTNKANLNLSANDGMTSTTHTVTLTGLSKFTTYYYKITATSADGTSSAVTAISSFKTARK